jgi:TRAP-type C4-dicarboxylate transport system substrate-binding protein
MGAALAFSAPGHAQQKYQPEYRLSTVLGNAFPWGKGGERWAELVKEKTQGRINIKMYPGTSLVAGDQTREFTAIRQGVIDLAVGSSINWSPQVKELNLFSLFNDTFTALGANPTQMSWADAQPALASGAVDGQENPVSVFLGAKISTVGQKYLTQWGYMNDPLIFVVNKKVWESWSKQDQEAVRAAAIQAGKEEIALARKGLTGTDNALWKEVETQGVKITRPGAAELEQFKKLTRPVYDKWSKTIGVDLIKKAETEIAARK